MIVASLTFIGREFRAFNGDGEYDWVDVKRFAMQPTSMSPRDALALLIGHVRFRDNYATATSHEEDSVELHGPYWLNRVSVSSYHDVSPELARQAFTNFASRYCTPEEAAPRVQLVEKHVLPLVAGATDLFQLQDLGQHAVHDWGWVLDDFTEVAAINRTSGQLALIVAAED